MGNLDKVIKINWNGSEYAVCELKYGNIKVPVVLDWDIYKKIKDLEKTWHVNDKGIVVTMHKICNDDIEISKEIYLHDIVLRLCGKLNEFNKPILHINKLGVDNRVCNLIYDTLNKEIFKNIKKKTRTINLPKGSGINPNELPSYVWYLKEDDTHGDRFVVSIGDINWKSTSSKKVSLRYKLEEAKKYLRHLKKARTDLFNDYSMNGDLNSEGKKLLNSFIEIVHIAGYKNINQKSANNTDLFLIEKHNGLSADEIMLLDSV